MSDKPGTSLPCFFTIELPAYWTQEQAFAIYETLDELRTAFFAQYFCSLSELVPKNRWPIGAKDMTPPPIEWDDDITF